MGRFNKTLLDDSRFKKVDLPQSVHLGLTMADLREAYDLFRLIDQDNSKTLETHECSSYLENMGYLDEQVHNTLVFAACAVQPPTDLHENITHGQADQ
jgi:Ca2+-binding EF-hand superfamily protein